MSNPAKKFVINSLFKWGININNFLKNYDIKSFKI